MHMITTGLPITLEWAGLRRLQSEIKRILDLAHTQKTRQESTMLTSEASRALELWVCPVHCSSQFGRETNCRWPMPDLAVSKKAHTTTRMKIARVECKQQTRKTHDTTRTQQALEFQNNLVTRIPRSNQFCRRACA